ncbi:MAG TPA: chemotaxis response regulator protein-glutamate methylesterase [Polyangiaceae bacterium]
MKPTRVLVIDDSALIRGLLTQIIAEHREFEVVGTASDPYEAWRKIKQLEPDVLTLDVEMPRMDGLTFLERLMHMQPMRVLMVSSLTESGCATTLRALELGAVDYVSKPKIDVRDGVRQISDELIEKLRLVAHAALPRQSRRLAAAQPVQLKSSAMLRTTAKIVAIGASTGGTEALRDVLMRLPPDAPPICIVQHMPPGFTRAFASRLDGNCAVRVKEAEDGDRLIAGHVLIAPGAHHMALTRSGANYSVRVFVGEPVNRHRPSVDVLFDSFAQYAGSNAVGAILTGMGNDGAAGLKRMRDAKATTIAQDEQSCVVYGMPKEAVALGAVEHVVSLERVAAAILDACTRSH